MAELVDVVETAAEAEVLELPPLIITDSLAAVLPGEGELQIERFGHGHSNITFLVRRGDMEWILRRPPRPPIPPTAHDVLREYRVLSALKDADVRTPKPVMACQDEAVIGAPFYLMERVAGTVMRQEIPAQLDNTEQRHKIGFELVDALVELHALDPAEYGLQDLGRPSGYLQRQLKRWQSQWQHNKTREVAAIDEVTRVLESHIPESPSIAIVHGDYKLDNVVYSETAPATLVGILDWEMATLGDPLADLGYMTATYAQPGDPSDGLIDLAGDVTRREGFPSRSELASRYQACSGRTVGELGWYQALALWKLAILLEGSYKRLLAGTTDDPFFELLGAGVPELAEQALAWVLQLRVDM